MIYKSLDIETTGLSPYEGASIFSYCIGNDNGSVRVLRVDRKDKQTNWEILSELMADTAIAKVCHNYHFELSFLAMKQGLYIPEDTVWHDTMFMSQLLRNLAPSHALDALCWELCGYSRTLDVKVKIMGKKLGGYQYIPEHIMNEYQRTDGERTMLLFHLWFEEIREDKELYNDYLNEIALVQATRRLEAQGILVDVDKATKLVNWLEEKLEKVRDKTKALLGQYVNLGAEAKVRKILIDDMKLPIIDISKKTGLPSTGKNVLMEMKEKYPNPIFDLILQHRSYAKGLGMITGYLELMDKKHIIHTHINTNQARTGRESSSQPNLQNISKSEVLKNPFPVPARTCFRTFPKHVLFLGDYAGIEMRLIVDASGDRKMMEVIKQGGDVHTVAAKLLYGKLFNGEKVKRNAAKNAHFAIPYGAGLSAVADSLALSIIKTKPGFERYRLEHPNIAFFSTTISNRAKEVGYVITSFGRKLYIPENKTYSAANYLIQGTAAGVLKRAHVAVDSYLSKRWNDDIRILVPVHDELIISYPINLLKYAPKVLRGIARAMTNMPEIEVPLQVEWKMSEGTWEDTKEYKL